MPKELRQWRKKWETRYVYEGITGNQIHMIACPAWRYEVVKREVEMRRIQSMPFHPMETRKAVQDFQREPNLFEKLFGYS